MPYAILRVAKIKSAASASAKTDHNYRKHELRNVDSNSPHPNREYVNGKETDYWTLATARIEEVVEKTRKQLEEQVMEIARILSGYSLAEADLLRRAMGKKIKEEMDKQRELFIQGATKNGVDYDRASYIFDLLQSRLPHVQVPYEHTLYQHLLSHVTH